jgi:hypothetical protein
MIPMAEILKKINPAVVVARSKGFVRRLTYRWANLRPPSGPFLSGDTFRRLADFTWDEHETPSFRSEDVRPYDVIFVSWFIWKFLTEMAPRISVPFFLISSNSDAAVTEREAAEFFKSAGLHWWATHLSVSADRISAIPLGLQNERLCWYGDVSDFLRLQKHPPNGRIDKMCWGFAVENNPTVRAPIRGALLKNPFAEQLVPQDPYRYRRELVRYRYVACPPGNGPDTHRLWEALALGVTPVVLDSPMIQSFMKNGWLPGAVVLKTAEDFGTFPQGVD